MKINVSLYLLLTIICPPIGLIFSIIGLILNPRNWRTYIFSIAWAIGILAFCYEPTSDSDLTRYYYYLERIQSPKPIITILQSKSCTMKAHVRSIVECEMLTVNILALITSRFWRDGRKP